MTIKIGQWDWWLVHRPITPPWGLLAEVKNWMTTFKDSSAQQIWDMLFFNYTLKIKPCHVIVHIELNVLIKSIR